MDSGGGEVRSSDPVDALATTTKAVLVPSEHAVRTVRTVQTVRERIMEVMAPPKGHARPSTPAVSASSATSGVVPIAHTLNVAKRKCTNSFKLSNSILTG